MPKFGLLRAEFRVNPPPLNSMVFILKQHSAALYVKIYSYFWGDHRVMVVCEAKRVSVYGGECINNLYILHLQVNILKTKGLWNV